MNSTSIQSMTPAQRAHTRRVVWLLVAYVIILPPLVWIRGHETVSTLTALAMAIVASLPVLGIFASWGRYLSEETDEYHHMLVMRRNAIATNATMGAAAVWGFLQAFGVMPLVEAYWIPVVWVVAQGCAPLFFRKGAQS
jgi:hypothetical protein